LNQPLKDAGRFIGRESASAIVGWVTIALLIATALWVWQGGWNVLIYVGLVAVGAIISAGVFSLTQRTTTRELVDTKRRVERTSTELRALTEQLAITQASAETLVAIVQLDATLLNALSVMVAARDREEAIRNILYEFLRD
jgi:hypothetical protein